MAPRPGRRRVSKLPKGGVDLNASWWRVECPLVGNGKNACSKAGINLPKDVSHREYYMYILNRPLLLKSCTYICIPEKNPQLKELYFPYTKCLIVLSRAASPPGV